MTTILLLLLLIRHIRLDNGGCLRTLLVIALAIAVVAAFVHAVGCGGTRRLDTADQIKKIQIGHGYGR